MSYLIADPMQIQAVDLNPAHVALLQLKLAAARQLPDHDSFRRLFAGDADADNLGLCTGATSRPISSPRCATTGPAATVPAAGGSACSAATSTGTACSAGRSARPRGLPAARQAPAADAGRRSLADQRRLFESELAPVFDSPRRAPLADLPATYFGLGIPPAQFDALKADAGGRPRRPAARPGRAAGLRLPDRATTGSPGRPSAAAIPRDGRALPPYLRPENFDRIRARVDRVEIEPDQRHRPSAHGRTRARSTAMSCSTPRTG